MAKRYRVLVGLNYPPGNQRVEPGAIVDDLPKQSIRWLLDGGCIEEVVEQEAEPRPAPQSAGPSRVTSPDTSSGGPLDTT